MRWTIKRKLVTAFGLAAGMMVASTAMAHWGQLRADATEAKIAKTSGVLTDLEHLVGYINAVTAAQRAYLISGDEHAVAGIPALRQDGNATAARVESAIAGDPQLTAHFAAYKEALLQRRSFVDKLNAARKNEGEDAAGTLFKTGEDDRLLDVILGEFDAMKSISSQQLQAEQKANHDMQQEIAWSEAIGVIFELLLLSGVAVMLIRSINSNVRISVDILTEMAKKDLSGADRKPASDDELATAIEAINRMKASMVEAMTHVAESSSQVSAAGVQIEATAREISTTTTAEQHSVEQFASSIEEMNATVRDVAENAGLASQAANDAVATAASGRDVVRQTRDAMDRISESVRTASADITKLGQDTQSIGEVVRIIEDIAGQTNLLALNAAIEAARAGEQGKGFAVVAQEVRQLAERTAKFTKEIADKIESVQRGADRAVQSMQQGEMVVSEGVSQFNHVSQSLDAIAERVETAQKGIAIIASATTEQSAATAGLTDNIHAINSEVARTAEQVEETAKTCAELARLASVLQGVVDSFQLPDGGRASAGSHRSSKWKAA